MTNFFKWIVWSTSYLLLASAIAASENTSATLPSDPASATDPLLDSLIPNIPPSDELGWEAQVMRAQLLAQWGNTHDAVRILEALLAENPQDAEALLMLAALYLEVEQVAKLQALLPNLQSLETLQAISLYLEGRLALWRNRVGQARSRFEASLAQVSDNSPLIPTLWIYRAYTLEQLGRQDEADQGIQAALNAGFAPQGSSERALLARYYLRNKEIAKAIVVLERGLDARTLTDPDYLKILADTYFAADMHTLASETYASAIQAGGTDPDLFAKRANLLRRSGERKSAWEHYQQAIARGANDAGIFLAAGISALENGQMQAAHAHLETAAANLPGHATAGYLAAFTHYLIGDMQSAANRLAHWNTGKHLLTAEMALLRAFIHLHENDGQMTQASKSLLQRITEADTVAATLRDILLHANGKVDFNSRTAPRAGERRGKSESAVAFWLGEWLRLQGMESDAKKHYERSIQWGQADFLEWQAAQWRLVEME